MIKNSKLIHHAVVFTTPHYKLNDFYHNINHRDTTTVRGQHFAEMAAEPVSKKSVFVGTMYHDIGHHIDAKNHENVSAQICLDDKKLLNFFPKNELVRIAEGIADHRSSNPNDPRSIIGKIIVSADRRVDMKEFLESTFVYRRAHFPEMTQNELIEDAWLYFNRKFGKDGYVPKKLFFQDSEFTVFMQQANKLLNDKELFKKTLAQTITDFLKNENKAAGNII